MNLDFINTKSWVSHSWFAVFSILLKSFMCFWLSSSKRNKIVKKTQKTEEFVSLQSQEDGKSAWTFCPLGFSCHYESEFLTIWRLNINESFNPFTIGFLFNITWNIILHPLTDRRDFHPSTNHRNMKARIVRWKKENKTKILKSNQDNLINSVVGAKKIQTGCSSNFS